MRREKMKRKILATRRVFMQLLFLALLFSAVSLISENCINIVQAKKTVVVSKKTITLITKDDEDIYDYGDDDDDYDYDDDDYDDDFDYDYDDEEDEEDEEDEDEQLPSSSHQFTFTLKGKVIPMINVDVRLLDECTKGGFKIQLFNSSGKAMHNDSYSLKGYDYKSTYSTWAYADKFFASPGEYTYKIINTSDAELRIAYTVNTFTDFSKTAKISKKVKNKSTKYIKIGKIDDKNFPYIKSLKCSKKGLINRWYYDCKGNIYVYTWTPGSGTITVELKNGKKYKTQLTVTPNDPDFLAQLTAYNTRDNYFTVYFKNVGSSTLKILPTGAYSQDDDYKVYDRKLSLSKNKAVSIKPGKTKAVKFKVKGKLTWHDYTDHSVYYYFNYCGKKFLGCVWYNGSAFKKSKKWYTTYWSEKEYQDWL